MNKDGLNVNGTTVGSNSIKLGTAAGDLALTKTQMQVGGAAGSTLTSSSLKIGGATLNGTSLSFGSNTPSLSNNGLAMASKKITGLANGTTDNDAVNVSQLNAAKAAATTKVAASGTNINVTSVDNADGSKTYTANLNDTINLTQAGSVNIGDAVLNKDGLKVGSAKFNSAGVEFGTGSTPSNYLRSDAFKIGNLTLDTNGLNLASGSLVAGAHRLGTEGLSLASGASVKVGSVTLNESGLSLKEASRITGLSRADASGQPVEYEQFVEALEASGKTVVVSRAAPDGNLKESSWEDEGTGTKYKEFSLANQVQLKGEGDASASLEILNPDGTQSFAKLDNTGLTVGSAKFNSNGVEFDENHYVRGDAFKVGNLSLAEAGLTLSSGALKVAENTLDNQGLSLASGSSVKVGGVTLNENGLNLSSGSQITGLGAATAQGQAVEYSQFDEAIKETKKSAVVTRAAANGNLIVGDQQTDEKGAYAEIALANRVKLRGEAGTEGQEVSASLEILNPDGTQSYVKLDKDGLRVGDSLSITGSSVGFTGGPALRYGSDDLIGLDMAGKKIAHVQDGVADDDAVNVRQMNANVTKLVGGSTNVVVTEDQSYEGPGKQYKVDLGNRVTFGTGNSALTLDSRGLRIGSAATFSKDEISVKSSVNGSAVIKGGSIQVSQGDSRVSIDTAQIQLGSTTISSGSIKMGGNNGLQLRSDGMIGRGRSTLQFNPETSTVAFSNQRLTGLLAGTGSQDAATVGQLERLYNHLVDKGVLQEETQTAARTATLAKTRTASGANLGGEENASVNTLALENGSIVGQQTVKGLTGGANLLSAPASAVNKAVALESGSSNVDVGITPRAADYSAGTGIAINNNAISLADDIEVKSVKADSVKTKTVEASEKITVGTADSAVVIEPSRIYFSSQGPSISKSGIDAGGNRITGVADGVAPTDAVNVRQMNQVSGHLASRINDVDKRAKAGIAQAIATAGLPQAYRPGAGMASAALGTFGGQGAIAIGVSKISDNGHWVFKGTFSGNTQSKVGGSVGVGYQW